MKKRSVAGVVLVVAAVAGAVVAVRLAKRSRPVEAPPPPPVLRLTAGGRTAASRSLIRMAVAAAVVIVVGLAGIVATRPADEKVDPEAGEQARQRTRELEEEIVAGLRLRDLAPDAVAPIPLASCQALLATWPAQAGDCGYAGASVLDAIDEPAADPNDPKYAGAALPTALSTNGLGCSTGPGRPTLDVAYPVLSSSFIPVPGLSRIQSTFQVTRLDGRHDQDVNQAGAEDRGGSARLDFRMLGTPLTHGAGYRWRVRATPPSIPAGGWSEWCEFTIAKFTSDDLGLVADQPYTVTLPVVTWRSIAALLGPVETYAGGELSEHAPIAAAARRPARTAAVAMTGRSWEHMVSGLAYAAAKNGESWGPADTLSTALGGPPHPTMGFERK
ncbi:hypothetical protein [Actinoplanes sp. NPDC049265]|uniref:hypothetical protein n=1 Tax=Actinoplanes sp. NPDC049265 TaxID=3363902 RepID=UPI0037146D2E